MNRLAYRCHRCGQMSASLAAAERHADQQRHPRFEVLIR